MLASRGKKKGGFSQGGVLLWDTTLMKGKWGGMTGKSCGRTMPLERKRVFPNKGGQHLAIGSFGL